MTGDRTCPCCGSWLRPDQWSRVDKYAPAVWPLTVGASVAPLTVGPFEPYNSAGEAIASGSGEPDPSIASPGNVVLSEGIAAEQKGGDRA